MRILWIEDEQRILDEGCDYLNNEGYEAVGVASYTEAQQLFENGSIELVIVDWMLPGHMSGLEICKLVQARWSIPVIMVTAKADELDKVVALEVGADDYIVKPFSLRELSARIKAVMRRAGGKLVNSTTSSDQVNNEEVIIRGNLIINATKYIATINDQQLSLTRSEFMLLYVLASHPGRVYSRNQLLESALGDSYAGFERTMDSHIRNLRRKIENDTANPQYILTVYGVGYKFGDAI